MPACPSGAGKRERGGEKREKDRCQSKVGGRMERKQRQREKEGI